MASQRSGFKNKIGLSYDGGGGRSSDPSTTTTTLPVFNRKRFTSKDYQKQMPSVSIALRRFLLKVRVLPPPVQAVLALSVIAMILFFVWTILLSPQQQQDDSSRFRNRPHFPDKPRVLQLLPNDNDNDNDNDPNEYNNVQPLLILDPEQPLFQYAPLREKDNPMPKQNVKLKAASTMDKGGCSRVEDWQIGHNPNCNVVHESTWGWNHIFSDHDPRKIQKISRYDEEYEQARLVAGGAFRHVWMIREFDGTKRALKTLRVDSKNKNFDLRSYDRHRRDAVSVEQLTKSPLIVDIFGYCSNSALYDWGEGGDLESIFERDPHITKDELLNIAYNVSLSLHHAHNFNDLGRPTIAHTDIKVDQFLYQDGYYRLTDFNRVRFLMWNEKKNLQCGFRVPKNGGIWRSPEEYNYEVETEKVDVYSLGNVLYFLLIREIPWNDYATKEIYALVKDGKRPAIPEEIMSSDHPYDKYMMEAINMAFTHNKIERPGALEIANKLKEGIDEL